MTETPQSGSGAGVPIGEVPLPPGYVLVGRLGSGGFATVWLAEQARLGRRVAVKLLGESLSDGERERRFVAECRAIGRLSGHPSVVTVHDAGTTDAGHPYLVMEHLPGGSLQDRVAASGPLPWPEAVEAAVCVGDALSAAHDAGILHRDVKPANVLLDGEGHPKLGDFGIARLAEGAQTATGTVVGTLAFTPPEVLSGERPTTAADIWSLGATVHALLTGRSPSCGPVDEAPAAIIARVLRGEVAPLSPSVPEQLRALVADCLRTEPDARPPDAASVVGRLQALQAAHSLPITPARAVRTPPPPSAPPRRAPAPAAAPAPPPPTVVDPRPPTPPAAPAASPGGPSRALLVAAAAATLVAVVVAAIVLWPDSGGDDESGGEDAPPSTTEVPPPTGVDGAPLTLLSAPAEAPEARWEVPFPCGEGCRGVGSDDLAVLASATGEVVALDPGADDATSAVAWEATLDGATGVPWVVLADPLVVVEVPISEATHRLVALDAGSGATRWEVEVPGLARGGIVGDPAAATLVVMGSDPDDTTPDGLDRGSTSVVDATTGALLWSTTGHPVGTTDDLVAVSDGTDVTGHDRRSGAERWSSEVPTGPLVAAQAQPRGVLAHDRLVVVSEFEGVAVGLDPDDGRQWRTPLPAGAAPDASTGVVAAVQVEGGAVAVICGPGGMVALDPSDGTSLWDVADGDPIAGDGSLLAWIGTREALVVGREDGTLTARDLADGRVTASASVEGVEQWLLLDGQVLARAEGTVVAHDAATLEEVWRVAGGAETLVAAPHGYLAATGEGVVRLEGPG